MNNSTRGRGERPQCDCLILVFVSVKWEAAVVMGGEDVMWWCVRVMQVVSLSLGKGRRSSLWFGVNWAYDEDRALLHQWQDVTCCFKEVSADEGVD